MYVYPLYVSPYTSMHSTHAQEGWTFELTTVENGHAEVDASHGASVPSPTVPYPAAFSVRMSQKSLSGT